MFDNCRHPGSILCFSEKPNITDNVLLQQKVYYSPGSVPREQNKSINIIIDDIDIKRKAVRLVESNRVTCYTKTNTFPLNYSVVDFNVVKGRNTSLPQLRYCEEG